VNATGLATRGAPATTPWLEIAHPLRAPRLRLFCFPYAGGSAALYQRWPAAFAPDVEVCAVQLPGRGPRLHEPALRHLNQVLDALEVELDPYLNRPFALFGHSMGALTAFELARRLRARGGPQPLALIVSGRSAPQFVSSRAPLHGLPDEQLWAELRKLNGTPDTVLRNRGLMEMLGPTLRADFALCETWSHLPEAPLAVPLLALGGLEDATVSPAALEGWRSHITRAFSQRLLPGDHFFLQSAESQVVGLVARALRPDELRRSRQHQAIANDQVGSPEPMSSRSSPPSGEEGTR
jgi:medium-chain acyl-[acyl-carrier-protein] hydrolase